MVSRKAAYPFMVVDGLLIIESSSYKIREGAGMAKVKRAAFTLSELLFVVAVIGILTGLLLPAAQSVREAARRTQCANNLKQTCLALQNFEATFAHYPTTFDPLPDAEVRGSWSIHAKILPMIEQGGAYANIDFQNDWHTQVDLGISHHGVATYSCPSDLRAGYRIRDGKPYVHSTSYAFNMGTWLIYDPVTRTSGNGAFRVAAKTKTSSFLDGLSNTLCAADVKSYTSYIRNVDVVDPTLPSDCNFFEGLAGQLRLGPDPDSNTGHTVWCDGRVHHAGFTTVFTPNTRVRYTSNNHVYDIDVNTQQEGRDLARPTYAAVTARSYHLGGINISRMDGSVDFMKSECDLQVWRAFGTASGDEINIGIIE